jgi:CheY-like chemotaxis protein
MNSTKELFHRIADPTLMQDERARLRCRLAKQLEEAGNYEAAREAMGDLWRGVGHHPVLDNLDQQAAAEVLLQAGVLTGWIGSCKRIEGAQEIAKNLISQSIAFFEMFQDTEKIAEAQTELGYCYWREGAFNEARDVLREALNRLIDSQSETKALALLRSAIIERTAGRLNDAFRFLTEAVPLIEKSNNHALKGKFYNQLGLVLRNLGAAEHRKDYIDRALIEYAAASFHFEQAGHTRHQARVENNLGFLFGTIKRFREAHEHLDRAQALFTSLKDKTHVAQVDDTRAGVLLAEGRVSEAEKLSRCAVQTLEASGQQSLLAEALTTHGVILARLGQHQRALSILQRAVEVAQNVDDCESAGQAALTIIEELGERLAPDDLSETFEHASDLLAASKHQGNKDRLLSCARRVLFLIGIFPSPSSWKNFSLKDALRRYERRIIERALKDADGVVSRAAYMLGFKSHTSLINRLNTQHPDLLSVRTPIEQRKRSLMYIQTADVEAGPLNILHVEDNRTVADAVKETLALEGWAVESIGEGNTALELLLGETYYDLLIFDNELPDISGLELICETRQVPHRQQTPIIMLSASDVERDARRNGANAFLRKPEEITLLTETIARLLARKRNLQR